MCPLLEDAACLRDILDMEETPIGAGRQGERQGECLAGLSRMGLPKRLRQAPGKTGRKPRPPGADEIAIEALQHDDHLLFARRGNLDDQEAVEEGSGQGGKIVRCCKPAGPAGVEPDLEELILEGLGGRGFKQIMQGALLGMGSVVTFASVAMAGAIMPMPRGEKGEDRSSV